MHLIQFENYSIPKIVYSPEMCCIIRRISWNLQYSKHRGLGFTAPPLCFEQVNLGSIHRNKMLPWCYPLCNSHQSRHFASPNQASDLAPGNRFATSLNHYKSAFFSERLFSLHCSIRPEGKVIPALSGVIFTYLFRQPFSWPIRSARLLPVK